jgi:hypothetical protein
MQTRMSVLATVFAMAMVAGSNTARAQYAPIGGGGLVHTQPQTANGSLVQGNANRNQPNPSQPQPGGSAASPGWNRVKNVAPPTTNGSQPTTRGWNTQTNVASPAQSNGMVQTIQQMQQQNNQGLVRQQGARPQPPVVQGNQTRPAPPVLSRPAPPAIRPAPPVVPSGSTGSQRSLVQSQVRPQPPNVPQPPRPQTTSSQLIKPPAAPPHRNH